MLGLVQRHRCLCHLPGWSLTQDLATQPQKESHLPGPNPDSETGDWLFCAHFSGRGGVQG